MKLISNNLSEALMKLFTNWEIEYINNIEHDVHDVQAWNELIEYLMKLEEGRSVNIN